MKKVMALFDNATGLLLFIAALLMIAASGTSFATSTIGGGIWTGAQLPDGSPRTVGNAPINNDGAKQIKVMVQDLDTGAFVVYGTIAPGTNTWSAVVPGAGNYLAMFMADGHDVTSREYHVLSDGVAVTQDAFLPPAPLPKANLLLYAFKDHYVNSEDDYPMDYALKGVKFIVKNEKGMIVAEGISGSQNAAAMPAGAGPDINGLYYFTNLEPGNYEVTADMTGPIQISDPTTGTLVDVSGSTQWYQISSTEGTNVEEVTLYPGDPGTTAGGYWTWFAFVDKQPPLPAGADTGSISGRLFDADGPWFPLIEPFNPPPPQDQLVTPNLYVPKGLLVLYPNIQTIGVVKPIATTEADPVTGEYTFANVPPGNYRIYAIDLPLDYIWQETQTTVTPGAAVAGVDVYLPRWFARASGTVTDVASGLPIAGAKVTLRIEDGSIWKETATDANGNYLFDRLPEVEVLGVVSVEPPPGYRAAIDPANPGYDLSSRTIQWYTANYKADLQLEQIPATEGVIRGFVRNDNIELKNVAGNMVWSADGLYDEKEEKTFKGITVELLDVAGNVVASTATGGVDKAAVLAQGWIKPYSVPPDEFGGVFKGTTTGQYEFRGLAPGDYQVRVVLPAGFSSVEPGGVTPVTLAGGTSARADLGIKTDALLAGEIEGGIFDDLNLDPNPLSILFDEKAGVEGAPLSVYDHLGYFLGSTNMGSSLCYAGSTVCPCGDPGVTAGCPVQKPEVGIRVAPGPHIFVGNDPAFPNNGYKPEYDPLPWTYNFGQGKNKFEADWSLIPTAAAVADGGAMPGGPLGNDMITPQNQPVIISITPIANPAVAPLAQSNYFNMLALNDAGSATMTDAGNIQIALAATTSSPTPQGVFLRIDGRNFGDAQGYSTVTLSGTKLNVKSWTSTSIVVSVPDNAIIGALVVATSTGISNAMYPNLVYNAKMTQYMGPRSVFVDAAATGAGNGSRGSPYSTINEALSKLPSVQGPIWVFVLPGTYHERIQIKRSNVHLIGYGAHETIINGSGPMNISSKGASSSGPVVYIGRGGMSGAVSKVTISGLTIEGGSTRGDSGGGIFGDYGNTNLDINTSIITRNRGEYGGGIWLHKSNHDVNIWSNVIAANGSVGGYGGGISVNDEPEYGPSVRYGANEHLMDDANPPLKTAYNIYNNLVIYNVSPDYGGGISLYEAKDELNVIGNVIMENKSYDHGGGIFFEDCGPVGLTANVFMHNYAADDGGAVSFEDVGDNASTVNVYNNLFAENIADDMGENTARGGALAFDDTLKAAVYNNTIVGNITAGTNKPRGGAIDSERHGHEYMNLKPAFSNVAMYNNIIWNNWRLDYDLVHRRNKEFMGQNYLMGVNYRWTPDNLHVDNPAVQGEWASHNNSESFTRVEYNDLSDGSYARRLGNLNIDPGFANPAAYDWHLNPGSPVSDKARVTNAPHRDLEYNVRTVTSGLVEMGAYEVIVPQPSIVTVPVIKNLIVMPKR